MDALFIHGENPPSKIRQVSLVATLSWKVYGAAHVEILIIIIIFV